MLAACAVIVVMYVRNDDMGGDPITPRGDGKYRPVLARGDGHMLYLMARSTALDGDWDFGNDLKRFGDPWSEPVSSTGRKEIVHPIGPALVWTPLIWVAQGAAVVANAFGGEIPLHGYTLWHQRFVFLSSALFGCLAVLLAWRLARMLCGGAWAATYAAIAILLGTSLTYYSTYMPSYSHAMDACACAAFLAYWAHTRERTDLRRWVVLGMLLGLATLIRVQEVALGVVILLEVGVRARGARTRDDWRLVGRMVLGGALVLLICALVLIPQFLEWHLVFGSATHLPQGPRFTRLNAPMVGELLFSARNGWFSCTPLAYLGCIGLCFVPRKHRLIAVGLGLVVLIQIYLNSTVLDWWSGSSFGQRRLCNVTLPIVVGLAALLASCGRLAMRQRRVPRAVFHVLLIAVLGCFVAWNLNRVSKLDRGKGAPAEHILSCCNRMPLALRGTARWIYDRVGNPFQFPANAIFALRHDVPLKRWDEIVGNYALIPSLGDARDNKIAGIRGEWPIASDATGPYLVHGWSPAHSEAARKFRFTVAGAATMLVPNLMPDLQRVTVWIAADHSKEVVVKWNGDVVARRTVEAAWMPIEFTIEGDLHANELTVVAALEPVSTTGLLGESPEPVGVAVSALEFLMLQ